MVDVKIELAPDGSFKLDDLPLLNPTSRRRLLKQIGIVLLVQAQAAFTKQSLGSIQWPERYPNQTGAKLNVAGMVADLAKGPTVKGRRFDARPAGRDKGTLKNSLSISRGILGLDDRLVRVGSTLPYAPKIHSGGESKQSISGTVRKNLSIFYKKSTKAKRRIISQRAGYLFRIDDLTTKVVARPFLGITDDLRRKIKILIEREIERSGGGA